MKTIFLLPILLLSVQAQANETHNFYFKKSQPVVEKPKEKAVVVKPAIQKIKTKEKVEKKKYGFDKKWEASFGLGVMTSADYDGKYGSYTRQAYAFGGRYFFNEYFDLNAEMFYDRGTNSYGDQMETHGPLFKIGAGTTPFHFTFLGYPFWEWGFDGGLLLGSERYLTGENMLFFIGHRQSFNFTRALSLTYNMNVEISRFSNYRAATFALKMAYRW